MRGNTREGQPRMPVERVAQRKRMVHVAYSSMNAREMNRARKLMQATNPARTSGSLSHLHDHVGGEHVIGVELPDAAGLLDADAGAVVDERGLQLRLGPQLVGVLGVLLDPARVDAEVDQVACTVQQRAHSVKRNVGAHSGSPPLPLKIKNAGLLPSSSRPRAHAKSGNAKRMEKG